MEKSTAKKAHQQNLKKATRIIKLTFIMLIALSALKAFGGYVTNIVPLIGDAVGSFSDVIATTAILIGLKLSQKHANKNFKYGFHRAETLISLFISLFIIFAGGKTLFASIERFFIPAQTAQHDVGIITALISIVLSLFAFYHQKNIGEKINSHALLASADDKRNDAFVSLGVLVSVVADKMQVALVEPIVGSGISLLVLYTGFKYGKESVLYLLDTWDEPNVTAQIKSILQKSKIVTNVKNIRLRHAGTYIFGEAFLEVNPFTDSKDLRDEIHRLDHEIDTNVQHLGDLVLYIDPPKPTKFYVAIPISEEKGLHSKIAEANETTLRFFFVEINNGGIKKFYSRPEKFKVDQAAEIATFLKKERTNILISSVITPLLYYNLRLHNIKVYPQFVNVKDVENTVKLLLLDI